MTSQGHFVSGFREQAGGPVLPIPHPRAEVRATPRALPRLQRWCGQGPADNGVHSKSTSLPFGHLGWPGRSPQLTHTEWRGHPLASRRKLTAPHRLVEKRTSQVVYLEWTH